MFEIWHRARDIMYADKTEHNVRMSKTINRYLELIRDMHEIINTSKVDDNAKAKLGKIEREYYKLACERGTIIKEIIKIKRREHSHFLFEDADFSIDTIRESIDKGENDTKIALSTAVL